MVVLLSSQEIWIVAAALVLMLQGKASPPQFVRTVSS
jgi:hypothetical protein